MASNEQTIRRQFAYRCCRQIPTLLLKTAAVAHSHLSSTLNSSNPICHDSADHLIMPSLDVNIVETADPFNHLVGLSAGPAGYRTDQRQQQQDGHRKKQRRHADQWQQHRPRHQRPN